MTQNNNINFYPVDLLKKVLDVTGFSSQQKEQILVKFVEISGKRVATKLFEYLESKPKNEEINYLEKLLTYCQNNLTPSQTLEVFYVPQLLTFLDVAETIKETSSDEVRERITNVLSSDPDFKNIYETRTSSH